MSTSNDKINMKMTFTDYGTNAHLRKKFKMYLLNNDLLGYKMNKYPQRICVMLVMIMEDIVNNCIEYIEKSNNGLYVLRYVYLQSVMLKYDYLSKYISKYNKTNNYEENLFFNADKVYHGLEYRVGEKLLIENESKNFLNYLMVCFQYEMLNLSKTLLLFSGKKTFNKNLFDSCLSYLVNDTTLCYKITLKMDSYNFEKKNENEEEEADEDETNNVNTVDEPVGETI